ncbi:tail protein [Aeromonas phage 4_L372X]|nr:tail protein [Aeromonas phage 4_L372X]
MATSAGELIYTVDVDTGRAIAELKITIEHVGKLKDKMDDASESGGRMSSSLSKIAGAVAAAITVERIAAAMNAAVQASKAFQKSMSDLSAITGATGEQLKLLEANARQIGATTSLSASQAAEAFKLIASAKPDLLESSAALNTVTRAAVTLAEAAGTTLPEAADTLGSALNQFGADASEANRYINVLAAGSKFGAAEVVDVAVALKNSGVAAASAKVGFETLNAAIQSLAAVGIKGGEAGTGLRNIILKLETDTNQKLRPSVVGLTSALQTLANANESTAALTKRFGLENITAAQALLNNANSMAELEQKLTGTNTAYEQASTRVNNLDGDMKALSSATEALAISIGDKLNPAARESAKFITELATATTNWLDSISEAPSTLNGAIFKLQSVYEEIKRLEQVQKGQGAAGFWGGILGVDVTKQLDEQRAKAKQLQDFIAGLQGRPSGGGGTGSGAKPPQPQKEDPKTENEALERLRQQAELARLSGAARSRLAAIQRLGKDATKEEKDEAERLATEIFNLDEQQRKLKKSTGSAASESEKNANAIADAKLKTEQLRLELENLKAGTDEASGATSRYSIESARLAAQQQLNKQASKEQVDELAKEILAQKQVTEEISKQAKLKAKKKEAKTFLKGVEVDAASPMAKVELEQKNALAKAQEYYDLGLIQESEYQKARTQIMKVAADERAAIELARNSMILTASADFFGGMADLTGAFAGEQSGAYKALFAISKGFAIANAALQLQTAIANASAVPWPANIPAIAQAVAMGSQIASGIAGVSYGGAREFGGPVDAGKMYRVGEGGKPEVFQSGGKNFMIPGDGGKVIPNDKIGGGGFSQNVQVHNYSGENVQTKTSLDGKQMDIIVGEISKQISQRRGGVGRALASSTATKWRAQ